MYYVFVSENTKHEKENKMDTQGFPSREQVEALKAWAGIYGRNWKSALNTAWMNGNYNGFADSHLLQQVRNTFGPSWLVRFVLARGVAAVVSSTARAKEYEAAAELAGAVEDMKFFDRVTKNVRQ